MEREYIRKQMFSYDQATRQIRTMPEIFSPVVSCHNIAAVWVAFSPSGLHSSQDSSDIVVDRVRQFREVELAALREQCGFKKGHLRLVEAHRKKVR